MLALKLVVLVGALFVAVQSRKLTDDERQMMMAFTEECRKEHKTTDEDINNMLAGNIPETQSAKCAATCVMRQFKTMKADKRELDVDAIVKMAEAQGADKDKVKLTREISEKCKAPPSADDCEFSAELGKCVKKECEARGITMESFNS